MGLLQRIFGTGKPAAAGPVTRMQSQLSSGGLSQQMPASQGAGKRELLRVVLRDTLNRHGIPTAWIVAELLSTKSRTGERGVHWRLHIRHWEPRLLTHCVALQNALIKRLTTFDPMASQWLTGISWQFALEDESQCPALPPATSWTLQPRTAPQESAADVIAGPVRIASATDDVDAARADLNALLALRDADFRQHAEAGNGPTWARTEPAKL